MLPTRWLLTLLAIVGCGCVPPIITARFPAVPQPPAIIADASKIGLAPVADSRRDESAGWVSSGQVVAGPEFTAYIQHRFRNQMVEDGFAPIEVADPTRSTDPLSCKTVLITLQSTDLGNTGKFMPREIASADIAVQVFAAESRRIVFASSYQGTLRENGNAGHLLVAAADGAIDKAFADKALLEALR